MIRTKKIIVLANSSTGLTVAGNYVACISISNPLAEISFTAYDIKGAAISEVFFKEGVKLRLNDQYTQVSFVNNTAEDLTITVVLGSGSYDSDRVAGEVAITGNQTVQKIIEPVDSVIKHIELHKHSSYFYEANSGAVSGHPTKPFLPVSSNGYSEVVSPSENILGIIINYAVISAFFNNENQMLSLLISPIRPTNGANVNIDIPLAKRLITVLWRSGQEHIKNVKIPSGYGLYVGMTHSSWAAARFSVDIDYEVL
jgi:hypothetical protein